MQGQPFLLPDYTGRFDVSLVPDGLLRPVDTNR